ncbi:low temperature requirement protein A [Streptococcus cuniculipharyngis]|uniref:Low temperature requirement protein A n=1 Tax=Streptococcus cuniculipharyngis TaxID=1562651 RepID=A0A5C5SB71_9STRE|nr:low temperature requirement protein A [Streptococcus cuniculipharyngis]TWS98006.1 low temperature requirement protein A [Streptococcus cuniculipharyngis]
MITHKKVEFTELFYDLVFVYALSKITNLIHHLEGGVISPINLLTFLLAMFILLNTWMLQTVFTNRYGRNSKQDMVIMFVEMGLLLLVANSVTTDWQGVRFPFTLMVVFLSLTLLTQYFIQYRQGDAKDKLAIKGYLWGLGLRCLLVFTSLFFPYQIGLVFYFLGLVVGIVAPIFFQRDMANVAINFPHLVERLSLLVIVAIGEMIVSGVAPVFTLDNFSLASVLNFLIVVLIFLYYFGEMDHAVDESKETLGIRMIYLHYPIMIGISLMTVSLSFLTAAEEVNPYFLLALLYTGLAAFFGGTLALYPYNKSIFAFDRAYRFRQFLAYGLSFLVSFFFVDKPLVILLSVLFMATFLVGQFLKLYFQYHKA